MKPKPPDFIPALPGAICGGHNEGIGGQWRPDRGGEIRAGFDDDELIRDAGDSEIELLNWMPALPTCGAGAPNITVGLPP